MTIFSNNTQQQHKTPKKNNKNCDHKINNFLQHTAKASSKKVKSQLEKIWYYIGIQGERDDDGFCCNENRKSLSQLNADL